MRSPLASLPIAAVALLFGFTMSAQAQNAQRHGKVIVLTRASSIPVTLAIAPTPIT